MSRQTLKNRDNRTIGYIETFSDGGQKATDATDKVLGYFDPKRNATLDANKKVLARANILAGMINRRR